MEDRTRRKQKSIDQADRRTMRLARRFLKKWQDRMGLRLWDITISYDFDRAESSRNTRGEATVEWQYLSGAITFYLPALRGEDEDDIEECVVHELAHMITDPIGDYSDDDKTNISEMVTTNVAVALLLTDGDGKAKRPKLKAKTIPVDEQKKR